MHQPCLSESNQHQQRDYGHQQNDVELIGVDLSQVIAIEEEGGDLDSKTGAEAATEAEQPSFHGDHGHAVGCEPSEYGHQDAPPPAILQFIHDEDAEDDIHDDVLIAIVQKHGCGQLIEVFFAVLYLLYVQGPLVELVRLLQELLIASRGVGEARYDEDDQAGSQEESSDGAEFEVRAYSVLQHVYEGRVRLLAFAGIHVGNADTHLQIDLIQNQTHSWYN